MARLGDICEKVTDYVASGSFAALKENVLITNEENYAIMVKTADFSNGFTKGLTYTDKHGYDFLKNSNLFGGELILSNIGSIGKVFKVPYLNRPMTLASNTVMIKTATPELTDYLYYYFLSPAGYKNLLSISSGTSMLKFNKTELKRIEVPVPEIDQQRHISAVLDKVSELIALRKQQLAKLDQLVKARFVEMFGNFVYERDRWPICEVGDVADTIDPQPSHRTPPISADGIPYIGIAECNYKTRLIDFEKARKVGQNVLQEHLERYTLDEGDFIIGKIGTIGKPFFVPAEQTYTLSANTVLIKPRKGQVIPQFLFAIFQSEYMDRIIDAEKKSTSQPAFGIQKVRKIDMPMPPIELQEQFAAFIEQTNRSKLAVQQALDKLETLKKALMQEYFG